jgi:hypothetical protein
MTEGQFETVMQAFVGLKKSHEEIEELREGFRGEINELRVEINEGFASVKSELRFEMHEGFAQVHGDFRNIHEELQPAV